MRSISGSSSLEPLYDEDARRRRSVATYSNHALATIINSTFQPAAMTEPVNQRAADPRRIRPVSISHEVPGSIRWQCAVDIDTLRSRSSSDLASLKTLFDARCTFTVSLPLFLSLVSVAVSLAVA